MSRNNAGIDEKRYWFLPWKGGFPLLWNGVKEGATWRENERGRSGAKPNSSGNAHEFRKRMRG